MKHFFFIPARKNSVGLKYKNRKLLPYTLNFIKKVKWIDKTYLFSDDMYFKKFQSKSFKFIPRPNKISKPNDSIKKVISHFLESIPFSPEDRLWLLYLTIPIRKINHFNTSKAIVENNNFKSLISFREVETHPFDCWHLNKKLTTIKKKYVENNIFRRQDKIPLYEHYHYLSVLKVSELNSLNDELINNQTVPIVLEKNFMSNIVEIDTKYDFQKFINYEKK